MKHPRNLLALVMGSAVTAMAHPGHEAPSVHAHDLVEALAMGAVILLAGLAAGALRSAVRRRRALQPHE